MFKTTYTKEEADELLRWMDTQPKGEMDLGDGIFLQEIAFVLNKMRSIVQHRHSNPGFAGQIEILCRLKQAYEEKEKHE